MTGVGGELSRFRGMTDASDETVRTEQRSRLRRLGVLGLVLALAIMVLVALALSIADGPGELVRDLRPVARLVVGRLGPGAAFIGLYAEESGLPLPVPGDFVVVYLGHHFASSLPALAGTWLGLELAVVGGASNLYLLSRHFGRRLLEGWMGALLHLTPPRLARVERWSRRWGPLAIIFGRHVFGLRPAVTVASGMLRVPYPLFALSTAISTAPWAALWLLVGVRYGPRVGQFLNLHGWVYAAVPLLVIGVMVVATLHGKHTMRDATGAERLAAPED